MKVYMLITCFGLEQKGEGRECVCKAFERHWRRLICGSSRSESGFTKQLKQLFWIFKSRLAHLSTVLLCQKATSQLYFIQALSF